MDVRITDHGVLQSLQVLLGLLPPVLLHPAQSQRNVDQCHWLHGKQAAVDRHIEALRELLQLAALLLVDGLQLLVLHPQPLLLQHDLLVQAAHRSVSSISTGRP